MKELINAATETRAAHQAAKDRLAKVQAAIAKTDDQIVDAQRQVDETEAAHDAHTADIAMGEPGDPGAHDRHHAARMLLASATGAQRALQGRLEDARAQVQSTAHAHARAYANLARAVAGERSKAMLSKARELSDAYGAWGAAAMTSTEIRHLGADFGHRDHSNRPIVITGLGAS